MGRKRFVSGQFTCSARQHGNPANGPHRRFQLRAALRRDGSLDLALPGGNSAHVAAEETEDGLRLRLDGVQHRMRHVHIDVEAHWKRLAACMPTGERRA